MKGRDDAEMTAKLVCKFRARTYELLDDRDIRSDAVAYATGEGRNRRW
jgi:hypothetical protein